MGALSSAVLTSLLGIFCFAADLTSAEATELRIFSSVAMKTAFSRLQDDIKTKLGDNLVLSYGAAPSTRKSIESGEPFDIAITTISNTDALTASGYLSPTPRVVVGSTVVCIAYREGSPAPQVANDAALVSFVQNAPTISLSDAAKGGSASIFFGSAMRRLGLTSTLDSKVIITEPGEGAIPVSTGKAAFGVALASEIAGVAGVRGVPLLPSDPSGTTVLVATLSAKSTHGSEARAFIDYLNSPTAIEVRRAAGL